MLVHVLQSTTPYAGNMHVHERADLIGVYATEAEAHKACAPFIRKFWEKPTEKLSVNVHNPAFYLMWSFTPAEIEERALACAALVVQGKFYELYVWWMQQFRPGGAPFYLPIFEANLDLGLWPARSEENSFGSYRMAQGHELTNMWRDYNGKKKCRIRNLHTGHYETYVQEEK